jgi:hypothetical protein
MPTKGKNVSASSRKKASRPPGPKRRVLRDVVKGPTLRQIEESLAAGTKQSLVSFRSMIGW